MFLVICRHPDRANWQVSRSPFNTQPEAKEHIRKMLSFKTLMSSAMTYKIVSLNGLRSYDESQPPTD